MNSNFNFIHSPLAPEAVGPYSQAIKFGNLLFCSGQIGIDPATGQLVSGDFAEQANQVLKNLNNIVLAAGSGLQNTIKAEIFLTDMNNFVTFNEIYSRWFGYHKPVRQTVEVSKLPKDALIEISLIVAIPT